MEISDPIPVTLNGVRVGWYSNSELRFDRRWHDVLGDAQYRASLSIYFEEKQ